VHLVKEGDVMEIGPIPGIRMISYAKTPPLALGLKPVLDMENYAHITDESYTPSQEASDSGMEDEFIEAADQTDDPDPYVPRRATDDDTPYHFNVIA
jgi:hypothetical protein